MTRQDGIHGLTTQGSTVIMRRFRHHGWLKWHTMYPRFRVSDSPRWPKGSEDAAAPAAHGTWYGLCFPLQVRQADWGLGPRGRGPPSADECHPRRTLEQPHKLTLGGEPINDLALEPPLKPPLGRHQHPRTVHDASTLYRFHPVCLCTVPGRWGPCCRRSATEDRLGLPRVRGSNRFQ